MRISAPPNANSSSPAKGCIVRGRCCLGSVVCDKGDRRKDRYQQRRATVAQSIGDVHKCYSAACSAPALLPITPSTSSVLITSANSMHMLSSVALWAASVRAALASATKISL